MSRSRVVAFSLVFTCCAAIANLSWAGYGLGSKLAAFTLQDQHGKARTIDERTRVILVTRDKNGGDVLGKALAYGGKSLLARHNAVYVADLSATPSIVHKYLTLPKLRKRNYPMLLDMEGTVSSRLPYRQGHATLIFLNHLQISAVEYVNVADALEPALASPKRFANR